MGEPIHPWVQLAPVYEVDMRPEDEPGFLKRQYLVRLTAPRFAEKVWVADLRIEWPVDKSLLVGREPIMGFAEEKHVIAFAARVGRRRDRAVLSNELAEVVDSSLRKLRANNKNAAKRVYSRSRIALVIEQGTRLRPIAAGLHVITNGVIPSEDEEYFEKWWDKARLEAASHEITLVPNTYHDGNAINVYTYDDLIPLDLAP
jgi:hypothetical protein